MPERLYVGNKYQVRDALGEKIRAKIIADLEIGTVNSVRTASVYVLNGSLFPADLVALAEGPLSDPIVQDYTINKSFIENFDWMVEVGFRPGVTDNVGRTAREAVVIALGRSFPESFSVHTGTQYFFFGNISKKQIERISDEILANTLIQTVKIFSKDEWFQVHTKDFPAPVVIDTHSAPLFREVDLNVDDEALTRRHGPSTASTRFSTPTSFTLKTARRPSTSRACLKATFRRPRPLSASRREGRTSASRCSKTTPG